VVMKTENVLKSFEHLEKIYQKRPGLYFLSFLVLLVLPVSFVKVHDIDIWWHMQCGKTVFELFAWPDFSDYYFTPVTQNTSTLRTTWLGDVLFFLIHSVSGDIGLQALRLSAVLTACLLVRSQAGKEYKGWHLLLLILLVAGTYQKQLIRNSLFALFLVPLLFWVWYQIHTKEKINYLWFYPLILGIWSSLHGSYLLGFGLVILILTGDSIDILRGISEGSRQQIIKYIAVIVLSFIAISLWNPTTKKYYNISRLITVFKSVQSNEQIENSPDIQVPGSEKRDVGTLTSFLRNLNTTIFDTSGQTSISADFLSPFDRLNRLYVWVALLSGVLGLFIIGLMIRPVRFSNVFPFIMILLAGMGYLRLCGYIPLVTAAVVFHAAGKSEINSILSDVKLSKISWMLLPVIICLVWSIGVYHYPVALGTRLHDFGAGRISTYSNRCPDAVFKEYRDHKVFTTMSTGGYLLYKWYPEKKVFVDGFFAPHESKVMEHLQLMTKQGTDPDFLYTEYGIDVALVEHTRGSVSKTFFNSENWYVRYVDTGMICFVYKPDFDSDIQLPEVWIDPDEIKCLPLSFKKHIAASLHTIPNTLYRKGRIKDAINFSSKYDSLLNKTQRLINPAFIVMTHQLRNASETVYGQVNTKAQFYEYQHNQAIEAEDFTKVIDSGLKIIEINPERLSVAMNIATAYAKMGFFKKSRLMFEKMIVSAKESQSSFVIDNKKIISKMLLMLSATARQNNNYIESYQLAERANDTDTILFSDTKLYETGIKVVNKLNKADQKNQALILLDLMKEKFGASGRWLNDMAWQLFITQPGHENLENARIYAQMAVEIFEKEQNNILDLAYDTLAEITFRQGDHRQACQYLKKARMHAPDWRKINYDHRFDCE